MANDVSFEQFRQEWMNDVQVGNPSTVVLGNRFAHKILTQWLDLDAETEDLVYCDGAGDGGVDIAYLHRKEAADGGGGDGDTQVMGDTWYLVQSKYGSAFRMQRATETFKFGRTAEKNSRRQTKFLFPMVVTELLKDVISKLGVTSTPANITKALGKLFESENEDALNALLDTAIQALDDYMDPGEEDSIYNEPAFKNDFNNDLNGMLKWEGLGKSDATTPRFRALISKFRAAMGMGAAGKKPRAGELTRH